MKNKLTDLDFSKHELFITENELIKIHYLKKPGTVTDSIKYINTNGILVVKGDYGNWVFCREFHPNSGEGVSPSYWIEKLQILSTQDPFNFDPEATISEIDRLLKEEEDLTEDEIEFLEDCKRSANEGKFDYEIQAFRNNCGRFQDYENVPYCKEIKYWLKVVFDGFDEMCRRIKEAPETIINTNATQEA